MKQHFWPRKMENGIKGSMVGIPFLYHFCIPHIPAIYGLLLQAANLVQAFQPHKTQARLGAQCLRRVLVLGPRENRLLREASHQESEAPDW